MLLFDERLQTICVARGRWLTWSLVALTLSWFNVVRADSGATPGERDLEGRLFAPCCFTQTLDIHDSPVAASLRIEIRNSLRAGIRPEAIESSLEARYGARIRAVPAGRDPRQQIVVIVAFAMALSCGGLLIFARRWKKLALTNAASTASAEEGSGDEEDTRIDAELERMQA